MNAPGLFRFGLLAVLAASAVACSLQSPTREPEAPSAAAVAQGQLDVGQTDSPLGGTSWRLVKIMSMDDRQYVPDEPALYTLDFGADGSVSLRADCNRGTGSWTSESAGQLQFGPIAATQAVCPPGSLYDRYMAQFPWVRSYVLEDGHLFLATLADGSIIEFEPMEGD